MKKNDVEKALYKIGDSIPVNVQLQEDLRNEFINKSKNIRNSDSTKISDNLNKVLAKPAAKSSTRSLVKYLPKVAAILILCLGVYMLAGITENGNLSNYVSAASLNVSNYMSFVDANIGSGSPISVSEYDGSLYIAVFGSELYEYSDSGLKEISSWKPDNYIGADKALHSEAKWVRVSPDGNSLVYLSTQGIGIYNIQTQESSLVLKQDDDGLTYYIEPTWHPDGSGIIYTKQVIKPRDTHGFEITESGIYYMNLETMESEKLADGTHGSYIKGKEAIIFERDGMIIYKFLDESSNNKNNSGDVLSKNEQVVDQGRFPSVSPCGNYVVYIKTQENIKKLSGDGAVNANLKEGINAETHESIENIWIVDVSDFENKKQITTNYPHYFMNETEWLKSLEPSELKQVLSISGVYNYYSPVWSSDSKNIYAIRSKNEENSHESRIIKIELSANKEEKESIVGKYLQALILRDDDYAKSLMKDPPELLTMSNPRYVGFKILESSSQPDKDGSTQEIDYVDAEVYLSYTANPYYMIEKARYYLSEQEGGYIIDSIEPIESIQVYERDGVIYLEKEFKNQPIAQSENLVKLEMFKKDDIPAEFLPDAPFRFSCLAYYNASAEDKGDGLAVGEDKNVSTKNTNRETYGTLIFALQTFDDGQQKSGENSIKPTVSLLSYSLEDKTFKLLDKISDPSGGIVCSNLTLDATGQYAAIDVFLEGPKMKNFILVYDLNSGEKVDITDLLIEDSVSQSINLNSVFWNRNDLVFSVRAGQQSMNYIYKPGLKKVEAF